jgi:DNA-binding transcriptional LysR family regulator
MVDEFDKVRHAAIVTISLDQARTLDALARHGTFAQAAASLRKGHTSIVYALKKMESQTGLVLLDRGGYRTRLTPVGERVLEACRALLGAEAEVARVCQELRGGWEPTLRVVVDGVFPQQPVIDVVGALARANVPTKIEVFVEFLAGVEETFERLGADVMISVLPPHRDHEGERRRLAAVKLAPLPAHLVAHRDHPLVQGQKRHSIEELGAHVFLTVRGSDPRLRMSTSVLDQRSTVHLNDFAAKHVAIVRGVGFGWLPDALMVGDRRRGTVKEVRWEGASAHAFDPHLYHRGERRLGKAARRFVEAIRAKVG